MEITLWKDKSKKLMDPDLFSSKAETLAKTIIDERRNDRMNKSTQIRKFYDEVVHFNNIIKTNPQEFETLLPYLKMLNAKAAYSVGRDLVSSGFKDFISLSLKQINDYEDFEAFASFFEAFIGYFKYYDEIQKKSTGGRR